MREIKFRAKRIDNGEWIYGYYAFKYNETSHYILIEQLMIEDWLESYFIEIEVNEETLGQFTGLTDKNGTEIYEGDIVLGTLYLMVPFYDEIITITWQQDTGYGNHWDNKECEVIGNIYDNKELLDE